jgi:outer membrane protein TolC
MRNKALLTLLIGTIGLTQAQTQPEIFDLQRSIELATDSSLQAFRAQNIYQFSSWEYRTYEATRLPSLTLSLTPLRYHRDFVSRYDSEKNIDVFRRQQSLYSHGNLSLVQHVGFTGGTLYVDSELGYFRNIGINPYAQYTSVPLRIGYTQSLFGYNRFRWEKIIEPLKYERARQQYLTSREQISETVIHNFFNLAAAQMEYDMAVDNVVSSDSLYKIGIERQAIASISQSDLLTLRLDALNARNTLKTVEIELKRAMFNFVSYLNLPKNTAVRLHLPDLPQELRVEPEKVLQLAKENNPDYLLFKQSILEAEREVDRTKKSSAFDANFSASVGFNQVADRAGDAYRNPLQQDMVRVGITIPLIDWGVRKGRYNMAKSNLNVATLTAKQSETDLEQDIILTTSDFNAQLDLINSADEARTLATLAYESTKARFIIGKADINSLTLSLNRLNLAQRNYINSLKRYWLSYYKLRKLSLYDFENNKPLSYQFDYSLNLR